MSDSDVKLDAMLGAQMPGRRLDLGRKDDQDTEPMARFEQASELHALRDSIARELERHEREIRKLDIAIIGTDIQPGVYAMAYKMNAELAMLRADIKDERSARVLEQKQRDTERVIEVHARARIESVRDGVMWAMAGAMAICAIVLLVGLFMK